MLACISNLTLAASSIHVQIDPLDFTSLLLVSESMFWCQLPRSLILVTDSLFMAKINYSGYKCNLNISRLNHRSSQTLNRLGS